MKGIDTLDLTQLKGLLSDLKVYKDMTKKLWKRGKDLFHRNLSDNSFFQIEYFPSLSEEDVYLSALPVYKKVFGVEPKKSEITFIKKDGILGGMKIYKDDNVVDMSFSKVERLLKK